MTANPASTTSYLAKFGIGGSHVPPSLTTGDRVEVVSRGILNGSKGTVVAVSEGVSIVNLDDRPFTSDRVLTSKLRAL